MTDANNDHLNSLNNAAHDGCAEFQAQLPELIGDNQDASLHPHVQGCANCAELVRDLMYIAQQAKLLLPLHDPSPELWNKIEAQLPTKG